VDTDSGIRVEFIEARSMDKSFFAKYDLSNFIGDIRNRRLHKAAKQISKRSERIADIAFDHGFGSHDVFGRAFKRVYGITPENYRKRQLLLTDFPKINLVEKKNSEVIDSMVATLIVTKPDIMLIGIERRIGDRGDTPNELWSHYFGTWEETFKDIAGLRIEPEKEIDYALTINRDEEGFTYFIGIEVSSIKHVPPRTVARIIPKTKYAKFTATGPVHESIGRTYDYIWKEWFPTTNYQVTSEPIVEYYDLRCATHLGIPPEQHEMDIYIPIESLLSETKEIVELSPYKAAYYKATGASGKKWHQVKKEAFDVIIEWTRKEGIYQSILPIRARNNGGVDEEDFYYEVFMDIADMDIDATDDKQIQIREIEGGMYIVTPTLHRMLEPTAKSAWDWLNNNADYLQDNYEWFEEFQVKQGKVILDTAIKIHFRVTEG
jgi:AraC family transcriptional regulator